MIARDRQAAFDPYKGRKKLTVVASSSAHLHGPLITSSFMCAIQFVDVHRIELAMLESRRRFP